MSASRRSVSEMTVRPVCGQSVLPGDSSPTSFTVRMAVTGLRSSCEASATKRSSVWCDLSRRPEQGVHGAPQVDQLGVARRHSYLGAAPVGTDPIELGTHPIDRPQRAAAELVSDCGRDGHQQRVVDRDQQV